MSEHHPDMDLIMALAGGELAPDEAARVESQLDPEARAELATQRAALAGLEELRRPVMTADESRRLHAAVREALDLEPDRPRATAPQPRRRQWFARLLPALAAAASLVAVIAIAVNLADRPLADQEASDAAAPVPPATTAAAATTTTASRDEAPAMAAAAAEEAMAEEADILADETPSTEEAEAAMEEAEFAAEEAEFAAEDAADSYAAVAATGAPTTLAVTDTTESLIAEGDLPADLGFAFSTRRLDDALRFTDAVVAERGEAPFPLVELADRAAAEGLVCWAQVTDAVDPGATCPSWGTGSSTARRARPTESRPALRIPRMLLTNRIRSSFFSPIRSAGRSTSGPGDPASGWYSPGQLF